MTRNIGIDVIARDKATATFNKIAGSVDKQSKAFDHAAKSADSFGTRMASGLGSKLGKLSGLIGGEVGEALGKLGAGFDELGEKGGAKLAKKLEIGGAALAGVGGLLTSLGAREKQATDQLSQAITNSGQDIHDYETKIESAVKTNEKWGDTAVQTKDSLSILTNETHDTGKALALESEAADLAAAKHESLGEASTQLAKGLGGSARIFKEFGVQVKTNADGTKDYAGAVQHLAGVLHGQAAAAADNWNGKLKQLRAEIEDQAAVLGQKYGPAVTAAGIGLIAFGPIIGKAVTATRGLGTASATVATEVVSANGEIIASEEAVAASAGAARLSMLGIAGAAAAVIAFGPQIRKTLHIQDPGDAFKPRGGDITSAAKDTTALTTALINNKGAIQDVKDEWASAQGDALDLTSDAAKLGIKSDVVTKAIEGQGNAFEYLNGTLKAAGFGPTAYRLGLLHDAFAQADAATQGDTTSTVANGTAQKNLTPAIDAATLAMMHQNDAAGILSQGFDKLHSKLIDAYSANLSLKDSEQGVADAIKTNGKTLDENTAAGRSNIEAILAARDAAEKHADAVAKSTGSSEKAEAAYRADIVALKAQAKSLGINVDSVAGLSAAINTMPTYHKTDIDVRTDAARKTAADIAAWLDKVLPTERYITLHLNTQGAANQANQADIHGYASGTDSAPGGVVHLAEQGYELVRYPTTKYIPPGTQVLNHSQSQAVMGAAGGGGKSITVNNPQFTVNYPLNDVVETHAVPVMMRAMRAALDAL